MVPITVMMVFLDTFGTKVFKNGLLVCAGVCWRVLACAGVCWCVLVCAGVCWCTLVGADFLRNFSREIKVENTKTAFDLPYFDRFFV